MPAFFVRPDVGPSPAVLLIHDIYGANDFYHDVARRLAADGFVVLLPDLFAREGPLPEPTREAAFARRAKHSQVTALADIAKALDWLKAHDATTGKVGTVGFCMGGTLGFLAAARDPLPDATVAYYGFPKGQKTELAPLAPLDEPEQVKAPLLGLWGDQDAGVGMENVAAYDAALTSAGVAHEFVIYPGIGHGFLTFDPDSPAFDGARDSYRRMIAFFQDKLAG
ncbi:MAG: dienelactone hydrolase family protein [Thermomicrobiales bacterium]